MILYRHAPRGLPFLWETAEQPAGRWHGTGEGPVQYLTDTPDGAWAEFLRHEGIADAEELAGIDRAVWVVEAPDGLVAATREPALPPKTMLGGLSTYTACQNEARRLRTEGAIGLQVPSAALVTGGAQPWRVAGGLQPADPRDGRVIVLFGPQADLIGWRVVDGGRPSPDLLARIRPLYP